MIKMIGKSIKIAIAVFSLLGVVACNSGKKQSSGDGGSDTLRTVETERLYARLQNIPQEGFMFGHQDATVYGVGWEGDSARSDVKSVCDDYPAVCGWEVGCIETGKSASLDNVSFDIIRREMILNYLRGGMNTLSWHANNPVTGGDSWDVLAKDSVVKSILPGGVNHDKLMGWLDTMVTFFHSLKTEDGIKVPVLFRPWHEHTGSWFWWGKDYCTPEQYKELWVMTYDYFQSKGVDNVLYAYSPGGGVSAEEYMERYPGDMYTDLLGFDYYQMNGAEGTDSYCAVMNNTLTYLAAFGKERRKPIAVTETGLEALPVENWWTNVLYPILEKYPVSYVLLWRNAREKPNHYYAPYPGQLTEKDFVEFYNHPRTLFCKDLKGLLYN